LKYLLLSVLIFLLDITYIWWRILSKYYKSMCTNSSGAIIIGKYKKKSSNFYHSKRIKSV